MKKNIILVDFEIVNNWSFLNELKIASGEDWIVLSCANSKMHGSKIKNIFRILQYFIFPFKVFMQRKNYSKIIAWQQFYGLNFALFSRFLSAHKRNDLYVMTFIYKRKHGFIGKIYHLYMSYIVKSQYIDKFIVFSLKECAYYSSLFDVPREKFSFIPLGIPDIDGMEKSDADEKYIFSTGRSNRDYDFLINALSGTDYKLKIACDSYMHEDTENICILKNCYGKEMQQLLYNSYCVVIPLKEVNISAGQLVLLQAMQLKKPIIVTNSRGVLDYVENNKNGILINNVKSDLLEALNRLYTDKELYERLSENGYEKYKEKYSIAAMAQHISKIL